MSTYFLIITPLLASLISLITGMKRRTIESIAVASGVIEFIAALSIAFSNGANGKTIFAPYLYFDALGAWFLIITSLLGCLGLIYSVSYLRREEKEHVFSNEKIQQYYALFHLFVLSMFVAVNANNALLLWIAVEATTLCSAFLVNFFDKPAAIEAAWRYMIINTVGLLLCLFGVFLFIGAVGHVAPDITSLDWKNMSDIAPLLNILLVKLAFVFMMIGYGTKAGLAPLHNWLPDTHGQAPSPVSAMLSGALLNVALLALIRFKVIVDITVGVAFSQTILLAFGTASIVIAAALILVQKQYKRMLAYSSVEHIGIIAFGFAMGGVGTIAALLHALYHSLAKSMLFLATGNIILRYKENEIGKIKGLLRTLPITGVLFFAGLLAVAGLPPFGIFLTEFAIFSSAFKTHPALTITAILALALAFAGIIRHATSMFFGEPDKDMKVGEDDMLGTLPLVILFVLLVVLSLSQPDMLVALLHRAALSL